MKVISLAQTLLFYDQHTCEPVTSKKLENFAGELAKKLENFVGHRHTDNLDKIMQK